MIVYDFCRFLANYDLKRPGNRLFGAGDFTKAMVLAKIGPGYNRNSFVERQRVGGANPHTNPTPITLGGIDLGNRLALYRWW